MPTCHIHADRETGRSCTRCGRPACPSCLIDAAVGSHCVSCVKAAQPSTRERARRAWKGDALIATKAILAVNVAVHLLSMAGSSNALSRGNRLASDWALAAPPVAGGDWWRILTAGFLHYGIIHLLFNCFAIYQLGVTLERGIGRMRFVGLYVIAIIGGSAGAMLLDPFALTAGASGGAFGLMGAAVLGLRQRGVSFQNTGWGPTLIINLLLTIGIPGISIGGHLGGLGLGLLGASIVLNPRRRHDHWYEDLAVLVVLGALAFGLGLYFANNPR